MHEKINSNKPVLTTRENCISCGSPRISLLSSGGFFEEPVHSFISSDPWGDSPLPHLKEDTWEFVKCDECDQMMHKNIIAPEWESTLFTEWMSREAIEEFEKRIGASKPTAKFGKARGYTRHVLRLNQMTEAIRGEEGMRILDFGCGWGGFLSIAAMYGAEAYGVDIDPDRRQTSDRNGITIVEKLENLDSSLKGRIHCITLFQVLEHLPAPLPLLKELATWIAPSGILILETPNCSGVSDIIKPSDYRAINPLSHINGFTPNTLQNIARRAGFETVTPDVAQVATTRLAVFKTEVKRLIGGFLPLTTDQYFRRT